MSVLENIKDKVESSKSILIMTHTNPDGDAMGSSLGLLSALKKIEKQATVYIPVPNKMFTFLPGYAEIVTEGVNPKDYDLCISLDSSDLERLGPGREIFEAIDDTIVIDHHITNQSYGDINYLNAVASSTCENLIVVLAAMNIAINKEIAESLYTGILTDTGAFRYNAQPETYEFVAMLLETGVETNKIYRRLFDLTTLNKTKLLARALERLEIYEEGRVSFTYITNQDLEELGLDENDSEGIVNFGRNIDGTEVSIFVKERDGKYKISLRANEYVDVSVIASKFAGGGHVRAAGFESVMTMEQIKSSLLEEIKKQLKSEA